jgi:hypothetical protein
LLTAVLEIFSLEVMTFRHLGYIFDLINGSFGDVTTAINHIRVFVADQILIGRCSIKVLSDHDISKGRQSIVLSAK